MCETATNISSTVLVNSQDRARMPRSGKHVSDSSLDLSSERTGYVEVIENVNDASV